MKKFYLQLISSLVLTGLSFVTASAQTITSFSPLSGPAGTAVTITGTGFNTTAPSNIVYFGPVRATVTAASATSLTVTTPISAGYNNISVTNLTTNLTAYSAKSYNLEFPVTGEQSFADGYELSTSFLPGHIIAGDLDNDGKTDLVTINGTSSSLAVFRNLTTDAFNFGARIDIAIGVASALQVLIDLDGDGKKDIVTASQSSGIVSIFRNTSVSGTISFAAKVDLSSTLVESVAAGDLNQDGKPDLVSGGGNVLSSFKNTSTPGNLSFVKTTTALTNIAGVAVGDIDGDGISDVAATVVVGGQPGTLSMFRNISTSNILFAPKVDFATSSSYSRKVTFGDLDGDGKLDAVTFDFLVSIFRNTSSPGTISMAAKFDSPVGVTNMIAIGDLDGDGKPEIAAGNTNDPSNSVAIIRNTSTSGTISFLPRSVYFVGINTSTLGVAMADLNEDGRPDLAVTNNQGNFNKVILLRNISLPPPPIVSSFTPAFAIPGATVTITGSNFNTAASSNKVNFGAVAAEVTSASATSLTVKVPTGATYSPIEILNTTTNLRGVSASRFSPSFTPVKLKSVASDMEIKVDYPTNLLATGVVISDIDGDGKADIAVANQSPAVVSVYRNNSVPGTFTSASFNAIVNFTTAGAPISIATADLDNDGKNEMITANSTGLNLSVFRNTSTPGSITASTFATKTDIATGGNTTVVTVSDINVDGRADLLYLISGSSSLFIAKNNSVPGTITSGSFSSAVAFATGFLPAAIATGDLNGDGRPEVVVANSAGNSISVYNNTSIRSVITTSSLAAKIDFTVGMAPGSVTIGDLNGDGKPEIIVANRNSSTISVFGNISTTGAITTASFSAKKDFNSAATVQAVTIGDINGDGKPDLLNTTTSGTSLLQNTTIDPANISFATVITYPFVSSSKMAAAADVDGDFKPEIILASSTMLSVLRNNPNNKPITVTGIVSAATINGATVAGNVNDNDESTAVSFEYGLLADLSDAQSVAATTGASVAAGAGNTTASVTLTGLLPARNYFYRVKAQNAGGTTLGLTREFSTLLNVTPLAAPVFSYAQGAQEFKTGTAITPLQPVNTGGEVPPGVYLQTTTLAGNSTSGYADGIDSIARFDAPNNVIADGMGNLYISDQLNYRIRKLVIATKTVTTVAGSGAPAFADGTGTAASFNLPAGLALDGAGNLYVADLGNHKIRKIVLATGVVTTVAGSTFGNVNGVGSAAKFDSPWGLVYNGTGYLYVADQSNNAIRRVDLATQSVTSENLFGLNNPVAVALDKGQAYILDQNNKTVRRYDIAQKISFILATSTQTQFNTPYDIVTDGAGNLYVVDSENHVIKKVSMATGVTTVIAGAGTSGFVDGLGAAAKFKSPVGLSYDRSALYVADGSNGRIRKISLSGYDITPVLPAGLVFDNKTGIITGTPTVVSASQSYTINAYNAAGVSTTKIDLATVLPPISKNADLVSLTTNKGVLAPVFAAATSSYQTLLSDTAKTITLKPLTADTTATVKINGQVVSKGSSATISLITGINMITTLVTAQDTTIKKIYTLSVTVPISPVPQVTPIFNPSSGAIAFGTPVTITSTGTDAIYYTTNGDTPTTSSNLYASPVVINSALTLKAMAVKTGLSNSAIGSTSYTQAATADLSSIVMSGTPTGFSFGSANYNYTGLTVENGVSSITITPTGSGIVQVNGMPVISGQASGAIALTAGTPTVITVVVTETGKSAKTYTVSLTRNNGPHTTPTFNPIAGAVAFGTSVTITSTGADGIYYTTNGDTPTTSSNLYATPVVINSALTLKAMAVKAGSNNSAIGIAIYTQAASSGLASLIISGNPSEYLFNNTEVNYSISFPNTVTDFTLTPTGPGIITVNNITVSSGSPSGPIELTAGVEKTVSISYIQTGKSARIYTIKARRAQAGQVVLSNTGSVTLSDNSSQVLITSPNQPISVIVPVGTTKPSIDYSALIVGGTGTIPQTTVESTVANMAIPASVTVTSSSPSWNGVLAVPTITSYDLPTNAGEITTYGLTIEVGSPDVSLSFNKGIRLLLPGQAGKRAGFVRGGIFKEITLDGLTDSQAEADQLPLNGTYKINVGADLVIWTKGFSKFLTFTRSIDPDIALLAFDKVFITEDLIKGQNTDLAAATQSLANPLPLIGPNGSSIIWSSSISTVISAAGIVQRPLSGSGNASATLTAAFKKGLITDVKIFTVTVLEAPNTAPTLSAVANSITCYTTTPQIVSLSGITPGSETLQDLTLSVGSDNANLFSALTITQAANGLASLTYTMKPGSSGSATVSITVKDNGGTTNGGEDTFVRTLNIQVNPLPVVQISSSLGTTVSKGMTTILVASGGTNYSWVTASGVIGGQNTARLTVRPSITTTYTVTGTNSLGCATTQAITISVLNDYLALDPMNIITPNGDGKNDFLIIKNLDMYPNNTLRVFDKAGRQIYVEHNYTNNWSGTLNGAPLADGTYYYFLDFDNSKGKIKGFASIVN